jgi:hypothetical protein
MSNELVVKCPKCAIPLIKSQEHADTLECQLCGFMIGVADWGQEEQKLITPEEAQAILERAGKILESPLDRKVKLAITIGGEWAKRFAAVQAVNEGFRVMNSGKLVQEIVKAGIGSMWGSFVNLSVLRQMSKDVVRNGLMSQATVDSLFQDMLAFGQKGIDKSWQIDEDGEEDTQT